MGLTVYGESGSRAFRALWMVEECGLDYTHVPTTFTVDAKTDEFKAMTDKLEAQEKELKDATDRIDKYLKGIDYKAVAVDLLEEMRIDRPAQPADSGRIVTDKI